MRNLKNLPFLLIFIILAFLFREIFLAAVFPLFTGQDEARHYNTIQWLAQKQVYDCSTGSFKEIENQEKENLATYRFSEEIRETSTAAYTSRWREENYRKSEYPIGTLGQNESLIQTADWSQQNIVCPPDIVSQSLKFSLFHWLGSKIETLGQELDILNRFYLVRTLAILFGTATLILAYLSVIEAGFSRRTSLLITFILSLQPRFSIYTTNINYDTLLIPFFALFFWAGLRALRQGLTPVNILLLLTGLVGAIVTKGTSLVLLGAFSFLGAWLVYQKRSLWKEIPLPYWIGGFILVTLAAFALTTTYKLTGIIPRLSFTSLSDYIEKSFARIPSSSENFWGTISWNQSTWGPFFVYILWLIEAITLYGLIRFFYLKEALSFLPTRVVVLFCLCMMLTLQIGIRLYDWNVFQNTGELSLGTPGRYFLPTLLPQLILIAIGLGVVFRKKIWLERSLVVVSLLMLTFNLYTVWLIIIPRFYL